MDGKLGECKLTLAGYRIPQISTSNSPFITYSLVTFSRFPEQSMLRTYPKQTCFFKVYPKLVVDVRPQSSPFR